MKTYSKKASKRTERAERSSSSNDDQVGKEQSDPKKHLNAPVHHQKMMKVIKKLEKRAEKIKTNQATLRKKLRHKKENEGKGKCSSKSVDFLLTFY